MKRKFYGGIHPDDHKARSLGKLREAAAPRQVILPLKQHIGAPCRSLVEAGAYVLRGEKIGDGDGLCAPIHASVSGRVIAVEPRPHPSGAMETAIVIENDFRDASVQCFGNALPPELLDARAVLHSIREAGVVGMGGAAFPSAAKAMNALGKIDTLIANACECEPYITADDALLRAMPQQTLDGMQILRALLKPRRVILAMEDRKSNAPSPFVLQQAQEAGIEIILLPTRYPQGSEKQLIQAIAGREVPPGGLPSDVGCAVFNISTCAAVHRAVRLGVPITQRIVSLSGEALPHAQNFIARIGTPIRDLIQQAGGLIFEDARVIAGGPMMGLAQPNLDAPILKASNAILCLPPIKAKSLKRTACLRCGKCVEACPMHLLPLELYRYQRAGARDDLLRLNLPDCILCGCCAYVCPARIPLTEAFRRGKRMLKEVESI